MRIKQLLIAVCIGTMFAACSSREDYTTETDRVPVRINASIQGMQTRSSDASQIQNTSFVEGAEINVHGQHVMTEEPCLGLPANGYAVFKKAGSSWQTSTPFFNFGIDGMDIVAYHPSKNNENLITMNTTTFTVQTNQTSDDSYRQSDLMAATAYIEGTESTADLEFKHCLTKITVILKSSADFSLDKLKAIVDNVFIKANVTANIEFDWSDISVKGTSNNREVSVNGSNEALCTDGVGVSGIIPPQKITGEFIKVYAGDYIFSYETPAEGFTFEPGHEYIFNLSLEGTTLTLSGVSIKGWTSETKEPGGIAN